MLTEFFEIQVIICIKLDFALNNLQRLICHKIQTTNQPSLYIYIKYIRFGLVGFYGLSTIVGYLMPNPFYTYILNIYDLVWLSFMAYQPLWVI